MVNSHNHQCNALQATALSSLMLWPGDEAYRHSSNSWWSANARFHPACIVQPKTTEDVSEIVKTLSKLPHGHITIRSGGHNRDYSHENLADSVTIDMTHFNQTTYNPETKLASLGPACRWGDVFLALEKDGVMVPGGRDGDVGVAGLITGGGNSYYTGRRGFVCDNLVNAEVVLADGTVVNANANEHSDLFKGLKGGMANFGIVTRFDLQAFEAGNLWGGSRASDVSHTNKLIDLLIEFTDDNHKSPEAAFILIFLYQPKMSKDIIVGQLVVDTDNVERPPSLSKILDVPEIFNDVKSRPMSGIANDYLLGSGLRNVWYTLTFKNDARIVKKASELHNKFVHELLQTVPADGLIAQSLFQPIPKTFADIGVAKGGNVLGLDDVEGNSLLWLTAASVDDAKYEHLLKVKSRAMTDELQRYAESIGVDHPWVYANYANPSQCPLESYGDKNIQFLRDLSCKYDEHGFFQRLAPEYLRLALDDE